MTEVHLKQRPKLLRGDVLLFIMTHVQIDINNQSVSKILKGRPLCFSAAQV